MELLTLRKFNTEVEAYMVLNLLASYDLEAFIFNNMTSTAYPIFNSTIGGTELKVRKEDYDNALKIINGHN